QQWSQVQIDGVETQGADPLHVGKDLDVAVRVNLGPYHPDDVEVQIYHGPLDSLGEIVNPQTEAITPSIGPEPSANGSGAWVFRGRIPCRTSGQYGFNVRVLPRHPSLPHVFEPGLVTWGQ